jgi:iron complex outermembrane recepter protein
MTRMKTLTCMCLIFVGVAPVAADTTTKSASKSLRMRPKVEAGTKRVAQTPQPDPSQPAADPPPADPNAQPPPPADATPPPPAAAPQPVEATPNLSDEELSKLAEQEAKEEVITVTGSTIERKTLTTPAPLTILNRDDLNAAGRSTVGDIIQALPAQSNAINAQVNNGGDGSTRVDIRGLGARRTLTLLNGRRVVPGGTGADASVDLNAIPLAVIERVEVLKDGASAVYGSDAIGGVVNIITRSDFDGTEAALYSGISQRGDGLNYDASFVTGHNSDNKRGNIMFSAGIQSAASVFSGDRDYSLFDKDFDYATGQTINGGSPSTPGGRLNTRAIDTNGDGVVNAMDSRPALCGPHPASGPDPNQFCTSDGMGGLRPFVAPDDNYNFQPVNYLYTPSSRYNVYSAGNYKFRPEIAGFFEASYLNRTSDQELAPTPFASAAPISADSIYNPYGATVFGYNRRLLEFGPRNFAQNVDTFRIVGGFNGAIPEDAPAFGNFKWEVSYNYGRTTGIEKSVGNLILSRTAETLGPSFIDGNGIPTCGTPTDPIPGCVPMNILGPAGSIDPKARDYTTFTGISQGFNQQQTVLATAHGRIAKLPNNGDLSLAIGADFRQEAGGFNPDPLTSTGDTTGNAQAPTGGKYNVTEGFAELSLVPISGEKFVQWLEFNAAARAFHYDTFGNGVTWKAGALFRTINGFAVRGTYSTAFRAPSVGELFQGKADSFPGSPDPCDADEDPSPAVVQRCMDQGVAPGTQFGTAQQRTIIGGNPNLEAETAKVFTAGVVFEPPQVKGLSLTVDYWNIDITKAIQSLGVTIILSNCYNGGIEEYCQRIHRDPTLAGAIDFIDDPVSNVGGTDTSGIDAAVAYDTKIPGAGRVSGKIEGQYLLKYNLDNTSQIIHGLGNYDLGVYPRYKANVSGLWQHPSGAGGGLAVRYVGNYKECDLGDCNGGEPSRDVGAWWKLDMFGSYAVKSGAGKTTLAVGVNNVLDRAPALIYTGFAADSDAATYDYMGRFFYARLSHLF